MSALLQTDAICKSFGALRVTDQVTLDVQSGELHAIIGPNGAGKTTLVSQLSGEMSPNSGRVYFDGVDVTRQRIHARAKAGLVRSYQITSVFDELTVRENATLAACGAQGHAFGFWKSLLDNVSATAAADEGIAAAGLSERATVPASELGYGERRQLELAMALATRPKLLLLDEPMAGMSVQESAAVVRLLHSLKRKYAILLIEHDMNAVFSLADRISVLVYGRVLVTGTPEEIRNNAEVRATYLGEEGLES